MKTVDDLEPPSAFPPGAELRLSRCEDGFTHGDVYLGERRVAHIWWDEACRLDREAYFDLQGRPHGIEREYAEGRYVLWTAEWAHGVKHGPSMMLGADGMPITVAMYADGRGVDLFAGCGDGISEVREESRHGRHGLELWGDPERPSFEQFFAHGKAHGILRAWDLDDGALEPGHPKFFVRDDEVTAEAYAAAAAADPSLRPYRPEDDAQTRVAPACLVEALERAAEWAPTFDLTRYIGEADAALAALWETVDPEPEEPA